VRRQRPEAHGTLTAGLAQMIVSLAALDFDPFSLDFLVRLQLQLDADFMHL